jgi:N-acetyl sugar amidotransferase
MANHEYQQCTRCVLDQRDDPGITFNEQGVCSFCTSYDAHESQVVRTGAEGARELHEIVAKIKAEGKGKKYDSIIGLSGGVDSTYLAWKARELGLRPLAVHFDNGWNSELAVSNIEHIVTRLGFDLHTHVIDWEEFRDLQLAFLKASVVDIEMITDHAILASLYQIAIEHDIRYILSGVNYVTESILPPSWIHDKRDHVHIRALNKLFGTIPLKKFPLLDSTLKARAAWKGIQSVALLNYMPYVKADVKKTIMEKLQWRDYGGKHYESVFTRFYQGYILVNKFGIDKRKAHLSNLICSKQITRDEALAELAKPAYPPDLKDKDFEFVLKKFGLTRTEFDQLMKLPVRKHTDYPVDSDIYQRFPLLKLLAPVWRMLKKLKNG